ncbi:flagellar assembly protein FliW [Clostridium uliginosum]|uniref:Flagellar assembly factor FliW n=1 Tax=Clostridium uliginosum TaxID=119641 RepID=A0A1I1KJR9_9CLOT|nr:flagellar assembly protein FliW [Clostridium uliginosum]SFC60522.1 flagellar assembly factor FliW [Clostridium uliginosum]
MVFVSKIHGKIEYGEESIINFKKSILGFDEKLKNFILLDLKECEPFKLLQSLDDNEVGLIVISPFEYSKNYEIDLKENLIKRLEVKDSKEVMVLTTVTLNSDPKKITTNLQAPIVINISNKLGEQIILDNADYAIKHPLMKE